MNYKNLKERQRNERENFHDSLGLRVHRALSWLDKAEQETDEDGAFVFLWIAFNAAYATELDPYSLAGSGMSSESRRFRGFVAKLTELDREQLLYNLVWTEFADNIRLLLDNPYVFQPFWESQSGRDPDLDWQHAFQSANRAAYSALGSKDTTSVISIILSRIYTLRNQLIHGGATYQSQVNRDQVRSAARFLQGFVPSSIQIMMENPKTLWGDACYPVV